MNLALNMMTDKPKPCQSLKEVGELKADGAKTLKELGYTDVQIMEIQVCNMRGADFTDPEMVAIFEYYKSRGYTIVI